MTGPMEEPTTVPLTGPLPGHRPGGTSGPPAGPLPGGTPSRMTDRMPGPTPGRTHGAEPRTPPPTRPGPAPHAHPRDRAVQAAVARGLVGPGEPVAGLLDVDGIRRSAAELRSAFEEFTAPGTPVLHAFAVKAASLVPVLRLLAQEGLGCEVASPGELALARAARVPTRRTVLDSPAKTLAELREALALGIAVNADNPEELSRIDGLMASAPSTAPIGLRVNPQIGGGRHRRDEHRHRHLQIRCGAPRRGRPRLGRTVLPRPPVADPAARPCRFPGHVTEADGRGGVGPVPPGRGDQRAGRTAADRHPRHCLL